MIHYDFIGVDIAKSKFNVALQVDKRWIETEFSNDKQGHQQFKQWIDKHAVNAFVCLEATGTYGEMVAEYLVSQQIHVSVVNPMQIKHYAKSRLSRNKTDKADARIIGSYAACFIPREYKAKTAEEKWFKETMELVDTLGSQKRQLQNQLESIASKDIRKMMKKMIDKLDKQAIKIEASLKERIANNSEYAATKERLMTIVGIGEKTAHQIIAHFPMVCEFKNAKQLAAYVGVTPRQHQSGQLIGKTKLSKSGHSHLRKILYMPALAAKNSNSVFKEFCERLGKNGLKPKQIICAMMRKLVHIIFGILKHKQEFDPLLV